MCKTTLYFFYFFFVLFYFTSLLNFDGSKKVACKRTPSLSLFVKGWVFMHSKWNIENLTILTAGFKLDIAKFYKGEDHISNKSNQTLNGMYPSMVTFNLMFKSQVCDQITVNQKGKNKKSFPLLRKAPTWPQCQCIFEFKIMKLHINLPFTIQSSNPHHHHSTKRSKPISNK